MFVVRTNLGDEILWDGSLAPGVSAELLTSWAEFEGVVDATPTGPMISSRPFPTSEIDAYWVTLAWARSEGGGIAEAQEPSGFDSTFGAPPDAVF